MPEVTTWLLEGPAYIQYRARLDLMGQSPQDAQVRAARAALLADPPVQALLAELANWPWPPVNSHKSAGIPLHKLVFVADLGLTVEDEPVRTVAGRILEQAAPDGPFQVLMNIPTHFGGSGMDQWAWALCDSPSILYALLKFGLGADQSVQKALAHLAGLARQNGWPCAGNLGKFRGPGRKEDPCPYANLIMLKALALSPDWRESPQARSGAETALRLWQARREQHPYMFYMGTDFEKLKAPLVWYDLLHVCDVLTQFPHLRGDPRLAEMLALLNAKADAEGRFTPESVWQAWKEWEFGQKKQPSRWLTLLAQRILARAAHWES
jgi:hypothetical protein